MITRVVFSFSVTHAYPIPANQRPEPIIQDFISSLEAVDWTAHIKKIDYLHLNGIASCTLMLVATHLHPVPVSQLFVPRLNTFIGTMRAQDWFRDTPGQILGLTITVESN